MTPDEVEALFSVQRQADDAATPPENQAHERVKALTEILATVQSLLTAGSEEVDMVAQKIGDGSRDPSWRRPVGESGLLEFFVGLAGKDDTRRPLRIQALRIIGNSCADTDANRERVVAANGLPGIVGLLGDDSILAYVISVLFNVCVDYDPAQVAAYKAGLNPKLIDLISGPRLAKAGAFMTYICRLLGLVANQELEAGLVHPETPFSLLKLAISPDSLSDLENFEGQTSVALSYLSNAQFQEKFLEISGAASLFLQAFRSSIDFDTSEADPDDLTQLKNLQSVFVQVLADLSAQPRFEALFPIGSPNEQILEGWLTTKSHQLQSAACLALGNIARTDASCTNLVQNHHIHKSLIAILANPSTTDAQVLHATLGFLKNLAIPASNKPVLGDAGLLDAEILPRIWDLDTQVQVQFDAVSLTRLLLLSCPANVTRICAFSSPDPSSSQAERHTRLHTLLDVFERTDQEPTKTEAARAVLAVLRVLHSGTENAIAVLPITDISSTSSVKGESSLAQFYSHHGDLPDALQYLGTQPKYPTLRSDLWFTMALVSRSPEGAAVVARSLENQNLLGSLFQGVTGHRLAFGEQSTGNAEVSTASTTTSTAADTNAEDALSKLSLEPQQVDASKKASMGRVDRENGLILVAELLERCSDSLSPHVLAACQDMLEVGGQMVIEDRETAI